MNMSTLEQPVALPQNLPDIELLKLRIVVKWRRPYYIPGTVIANVLRGAIGITFRKLVCPEQFFHNECHPCPLYRECAYGQMFAPTPSPAALQLRLQQDLPKPFVIEPLGLNPDEPCSDECLTFKLVLFGTAIHWLQFFITTIERLGWDGMGRDRMPFDIVSVASEHPDGEETLFATGNQTLTLPKRRITTSDVLCLQRTSNGAMHIGSTAPLTKGRAGGSPSFEAREVRPLIRIHFRTPMLLKTGSYKDESGRIVPAREVRDRPPFGVIARRLRDRLSALCLFFGNAPWQHPDFAGIGQRADLVSLIRSNTVWLTRQRTSTRTGQSHEISGFIGEADYEFSNPELLNEFWPLLQIAQHIHLGKHAPWGNGAVRVFQLENVE